MQLLVPLLLKRLPWLLPLPLLPTSLQQLESINLSTQCWERHLNATEEQSMAGGSCLNRSGEREGRKRVREKEARKMYTCTVY